MTPSQKLVITAAVLATGFGLALICGSPPVRHLSGALLGHQGSYSPSGQSEEGLAVVRTTGAVRLVPDAADTLALLALSDSNPTSEPLPNVVHPNLTAAGARPAARLTAVSSGNQQSLSTGPPRTPAEVPWTTERGTASAKPPSAPAMVPRGVADAGASGLPSTSPAIQVSYDALPRRESSVPGVDRGEPRTHIVVDGDSLARLAKRYLDDANRGQEIFRVNRGVLTDPDLLPIGTELRIPPRPLAAEAFAGDGVWQGDTVDSALERGLVPVHDIPTQTPLAPRAQLMRPMPAGWPAHEMREPNPL